MESIDNNGSPGDVIPGGCFSVMYMVITPLHDGFAHS